MGMDEENFLWELNENRSSYMFDKVNATLEQWIEWEYKIEQL
jgi:hypothetical protein